MRDRAVPPCSPHGRTTRRLSGHPSAGALADTAGPALTAMTLIQTAKLNGVEPMGWLTDVLEGIVTGRTRAHELHTLLPWNWRGTDSPDLTAAA